MSFGGVRTSHSTTTMSFILRTAAAFLPRRDAEGTLVGQPTGGNQRGINGGAFFFLRLLFDENLSDSLLRRLADLFLESTRERSSSGERVTDERSWLPCRSPRGCTRVNTRLKIQLVPPAERYRETFLRGLREFQIEGLPWWFGSDIETAEHDFAAFVSRKLADSTRRTETFVPKSHLWAVTEEQFVGRISIYHELNDALRVEGGHIGYDTVPSFRGRGVGTEMLRQALPVARALGLTTVLLTCDDTNAASIRVIERCGASLRETKALAPNRPLKRYYWITLP